MSHQPNHQDDTAHEAHDHAQEDAVHDHDDHGAQGHDHGDEHEHNHGGHDHDDHDHDHEHAHDHDDHDHDHEHAAGPLGWLGALLPFGHGHSHGALDMDTELETSERGIWAVKVSLLGLGLTAALQVVVVLISGSVALLADTIHNATDALTAL